MSKWAVLFSTLMTFSAGAMATSSPATQFAKDSKYFEISDIQVQEVNPTTLKRKPTFGNVAIGAATCAPGSSTFFSNTHSAPASSDVGGSLTELGQNLNLIDATLDQVINLGKKVWDLVQAGKPVVKLNSDVATALPYGAHCWMDLQGWSAPQSKAFQVTYKNLYGMEVVKLAYRVVWVYGGSVNGKGAYIGYAAIDPAEVAVAWGFDLQASGSAPTVYNMGSKEAPVAGMNLKLDYKITPKLNIKQIEASQAYFINGQGDFRVLE